MKQFYCDKLHCIRSDIVLKVVKFVSVKYSLFQINVSNKYKIVQTHLLKGVSIKLFLFVPGMERN